MGDIENPRLILLKGWLFLAVGVLSATLLLAIALRWDVAIVLAICVWSFCRWYYFMFYVIEHYVDTTFRFDGIASFLRYMRRAKRSDSAREKGLDA